MSTSSTSEPEATFICDCEDWMRSACAREPFYKEYEGKPYCVLHFPSNGKSVDFKKALQRKLGREDFNFQGIYFPDEVSFLNFDFNTQADFRRAIFNAQADFGRASFKAGANFKNAIFIGNANFRKASFDKEGKTDFSFGTFNALADFSFVTLNEGVYFSFSIFNAQADFRTATFQAEADFRKTTFASWAYFRRATFKLPPDFGKATFSGKASFRRTTFGAGAYFRSANFKAKADFKRATFNAKADLASTTFSARADFSSVTFGADASFNSAAFNGVANFSAASSRTELDFSGAIFVGDANFRDAIFRDYVKFIGNEDKPMFRGASSLDLQFTKIEQPDHVLFHTLVLRPHWFVNVNTREFDFMNVRWRFAFDDEIEHLKKQNVTSPHVRLSKTFRDLAINSEENHRYEQASRFRYWAMDTLLRERWRGFPFLSLPFWYWLASGYGERVGQAFMVLFGIWLLFGTVYTKVGLVRWEPRLASESDVTAVKRDDVGAPLKFSRALTYSAGIMTLQKPEPRPASTWAHAVVLLETIFGPVQAALLALAIRRKFMR